VDVVVAGLAVVDIIGRPLHFDKMPRPGGLKFLDSITLTTGGNVCNCGIDLAKMGFQVAAVTRVGDDGLGQFILKQFALHRIDTTGVTVDSRKQTSATIVGVGLDGERSFLHTRGCLTSFEVKDVTKNLALVKRAKVFALGYLGLLPEAESDFGTLLRTIKERTGAQTLLDTGGNPRRQQGLLRSFLPFVDYFIPSYEEAIALTGRREPEEIVRYLFNNGARNVVGVKLGSKGCYVASQGSAAYIPSFRVERVVDATGAGDAFVSGFLAATLRGFGPFGAARIGNAVAASCVGAVGASTAIASFKKYAGR